MLNWSHKRCFFIVLDKEIPWTQLRFTFYSPIRVMIDKRYKGLTLTFRLVA